MVAYVCVCGICVAQELPNAASSGGRSIHAALTRKSAGIAGVRSNGQLLNSNGPLNLEGRVIKEPKLDKIYCLTPVPEHLYKSIKVWWSTGELSACVRACARVCVCACFDVSCSL